MYVYIYPIIPKAHGCIQKKKRAANGNEKKKFIVKMAFVMVLWLDLTFLGTILSIFKNIYYK